MMSEPIPLYELYAIRYATREGRRADNFIGGDPHDGPMRMDYFSWVIKGAERSFVVDCGFTAEMAVKRKRDYLRCPVESLELLGLSGATTQDLVLTHLHYDHVGSIMKFPAAQIHLQEPELHYATGRYMRHPILSHAFEVEEVVEVVRRNYAGRVTFYRGDADACARHFACISPAAIPAGCNSSVSIPSVAGLFWPPTRCISSRIWILAGPSRLSSI